MQNSLNNSSNEIATFVNTNLRAKVRGFMDAEGRPWFVAKDVAEALGYRDTVNAIKTHTRGVVKYHPLATAGGLQRVRVISEGDMYRLIVSSKLPAAHKFESWIFDDVIPQIRRTGGYLPKGETPEQTLARAILIAKKTIDEQQKQLQAVTVEIDNARPKVDFYQKVMGSSDSILIGNLANFLTQNGYPITQNRLFQQLRDEGFLVKRKGSLHNTPRQKWLVEGLFTVRVNAWTDSNGRDHYSSTTRVTAAGCDYFLKKYCTLPDHAIDGRLELGNEEK